MSCNLRAPSEQQRQSRPGRWWRHIGWGVASALTLFLVPPLVSLGHWAATNDSGLHWSTASREPVGLAPDPQIESRAVIQVYAARAFGWRGAIGVHPWIAVKRSSEDEFRRYEITGWAVRRGMPAVRMRYGDPDARWFGNTPMLLQDIRGGAEVDALIDAIESATARYPYMNEYRIWPGPNSNTYIAWLAREIPELQIHLPPHAVGKGYLGEGRWWAPTAGGPGIEVSAGGLFGVTLGRTEGVELLFLGLSAGVDPWPPAIKLPGVGRIGFSESTQPQRTRAE